MAPVEEGYLEGTGHSIAIIKTRWNDDIISHLDKSATKTLLDYCVTDISHFVVPGAYELPLACKAAAETGKYDAIIAIGCVIRGDTPHFDYVAGEAARGITDASLATNIPIIFGVLTVNTKEQAEQRAFPDRDNKGAEFAEAAIEMANFMYMLEDE